MPFVQKHVGNGLELILREVVASLLISLIFLNLHLLLDEFPLGIDLIEVA